MRKNKLYSLLLSVLVSFSLWFYVVNNVSQDDDITFNNVPIVMRGETALNERNLMITAVSDKTVDLHLSGARSDLNRVNSGNITVEVDLSSIEEPGDRIALNYSKIAFPGDVPSNAFVVESKNPGSIYVDVDYRRKKEIPVQVRYIGERSEGYIYDTENATLDNGWVTVAGPAAVVDKISYAVIEADLTDQVESVSESFRYSLCDLGGNPVDAENVTTNVEEVRLDLTIQKIKEVELRVDMTYAGGATSMNTSVEIEPATIRVSGGEAVLAELGDSYTVGAINLAELEKNNNELIFSFDLPEGVVNQTGVTEAKVTVKFSGLKTKELTLEQIDSINVPEGMETDIINASLTVKVRGPVGIVDSLTEEDITAQVDFSAAEAGTATYRVNLVFAPGYETVGILKTATVSATVQAAGG